MELDENIHVAIRARLVPGDRAEHGQRLHPELVQLAPVSR
jgi:hypothetical protein